MTTESNVQTEEIVRTGMVLAAEILKGTTFLAHSAVNGALRTATFLSEFAFEVLQTGIDTVEQFVKNCDS